VGLIAALALTLAPAAATEAQGGFPSIISLPNGHLPEGIAVGRGHSFYAGSRANGSVYRGDLRTGEGDILVPGVTGRVLTGLFVDERSNYLFASGAGGGQGFVFDAGTGATLATYQLAEGAPTFVNDVVVTRDAAYFTDSQQPFIYKVPLGPGGALPDQSAVERIPLSGDYVRAGLQRQRHRSVIRWPLAALVHSRAANSPCRSADGRSHFVDLGGASLTNGDGLRLQGQTLFVVRNRLNQIDVIRLNRDWTSGAVEDTITDPNFDVPTTIGLFGSSLYAVNARFTTPPTPDTTYTIVRVSRVP
jgi:hypothetical protein